MAPWPTSLCVFCGGRPDLPDAHVELARHLGRLLADSGVSLIYGGSKRGLMGALADAVLAGGGRVVGVIPRHLHRVEIAHDGISELVEVDSMHTRKRVMTERTDAFCVLPGGVGTLDEAFEAITWGQLALHAKPIVFLDPDGYWDPLVDLLNRMERLGYLRVPAARLLVRESRPEALLATLRRVKPPVAPELLERS